MKKVLLVLSLLFLTNLTACSQPKEAAGKAAEESASPAETLQADETASGETKEFPVLTAAPDLTLTDPLSSTVNRFEVRSGNYSWSYIEGKELQSLVACGMHPLDANMEKTDKLKVPNYNQMERVSYLVSSAVTPSRLTVRCWDISRLGDTGAEAEESVDYEDTMMIELEPGKVYEITASWAEEDLTANGFYGEASYAVITE